MKTLIFALAFFSLTMTSSLISTVASADQACSALANYVGEYRLESYSCPGFFGEKLTLEFNVETKPYVFTNYLITSGPLAVGISTLPSSLDRCGQQGNTVTVHTCANRAFCQPKGFNYAFSGVRAFLNSGVCSAVFVRVR